MASLELLETVNLYVYFACLSVSDRLFVFNKRPQLPNAPHPPAPQPIYMVLFFMGNLVQMKTDIGTNTNFPILKSWQLDSVKR